MRHQIQISLRIEVNSAIYFDHRVMRDVEHVDNEGREVRILRLRTRPAVGDSLGILAFDQQGQEFSARMIDFPFKKLVATWKVA